MNYWRAVSPKAIRVFKSFNARVFCVKGSTSTRSRNQRTAGKTLAFRVLTNFSSINEETAEWIIANEVSVCTRLDGPANVHDWNCRWKAGTPHAQVIGWLDYFKRRYTELGHDPN